MQQSYPSPNTGAVDSGAPFYSSSGQQQSAQQQAALSNPDDLQLAAQSAQQSRNIAPMMSSTSVAPMGEGEDPRSQSMGLVNHQYPPDQGPHAPGPHIQPNHGQMDHMGGQYASPDGSMAPRKRSKVSRACDECRRKKIRCDATGEPGDDTCSSCKRVGTSCLFSRVPMKRGPSKGYIKELADRLNVLEGAVQSGGELPVTGYLPHREDLPPQRRASDEFSSPPTTEVASRKRTYSAVSGDFGAPYLPPRPPSQSQWTSQDSQRQPPHLSPSFSSAQTAPTVPQMFKEPNYSPNGMQPVPQWKTPPEPPRQPSGSLEVASRDQGRIEHPEADDAIFEGYFNLIHPTYPLLPFNKGRILSRLANCSALLKAAFYAALDAAVRSFPSPNGSQYEQPNIQNASKLVMDAQFEASTSRSIATNIIYLQIMLLLAIQAGNRPPTLRGSAGPSRSVWLGSAVGLAYSLRLHLHRQPERATENETDSDQNLARRIWWALVIMDRWHASSTASPILIPDQSVVFYPDDVNLLGESVYNFARLSVVVGHASTIFLVPTDLPPLSVPSGPVYGTLLRGELERFRESLPASLLDKANAPLIHLSYWHVRILVELTLAESEPSDLLVPATHLVDLLKQQSDYINPITYQCTLLAALALLELAEFDTTRAEAETSLKSLLDAPIAPSTWDIAMRDLVTKTSRHAISTASVGGSKAISDSKHALTASQGLQHLADLATATEGPREAPSAREGEKSSSTPAGPKFQRYHHLRDLVKDGYLSVFGGETGR